MWAGLGIIATTALAFVAKIAGCDHGRESVESLADAGDR